MLVKTVYSIKPNISGTSGSFYINLPDNSNPPPISVPTSYDGTTAGTNITTAINAANVTHRSKPVRAFFIRGIMFVMLVRNSTDSHGIRFFNGNGIDGYNVATAEMWTPEDIESPLLDATEGMFTQAELVSTAVAIAALTAIVR